MKCLFLFIGTITLLSGCVVKEGRDHHEHRHHEEVVEEVKVGGIPALKDMYASVVVEERYHHEHHPVIVEEGHDDVVVEEHPVVVEEKVHVHPELEVKVRE